MARIDKTDSAVGIVRGILAADVATGDLDRVIGVGYDSSGHIVKGAGQTGIVGVMNPSRYASKAGQAADVMVLGDIVDIGKTTNDPTLAAGRTVWADGTTGELVLGTATTGAAPGSGAGSTAGSAKVGFTVEADHLIVRL